MPPPLQESSSRGRSDSLDDPGLPEQDRKRQKLNSASLEIGAESGTTPSEVVSESPDTVSAEDQNQFQVAPAGSAVNIMTTSPTSKVTINTRTSAPQSAMAQGSEYVVPMLSNGKRTPPVETAAEAHSDAIVSSTTNMDVDLGAVETISISSTSSNSPEIEVAELEDIDQDPSQTRWKSTSRGRHTTPALSSSYVFRTFPYAQALATVRNSHHAIRAIGQYFEKGHERDGEVFLQVKVWLATFLQDCSRMEKQFMDYEPQFWQDVPDLVTSLLRRRIDPPPEARPKDLEDFFVDYARLALLVVDLDARELRSLSKETSSKDIADLYSRHYTPTLSYIVQYHDVPFYLAVARSRPYVAQNLTTAVLDRLADPQTIDILGHYIDFLHEIGAILPRKATYANSFVHLITAASQYIRSSPERKLDGAEISAQEKALMEHIKDKSLQFFMDADDILQHSITKQFQWLNIDNNPEVLKVMSQTMHCLAEHQPVFKVQMITNCGVNQDGIHLMDADEIPFYAWKFKTLRKYITHGRMELRVQGVEIMARDLVQVYQRYVQHQVDFMSVPLVRFLVKFLQETKLINYIVGVDSHPQLIARSGNIVGFLCVTFNYTNEDTDIIWRAVTNSQDSRTVIAVFDLLKADFNMMENSALNYLCHKLYTMPVERFGMRLLDFTGDLLQRLRELPRVAGIGQDTQDPLAIDLCIRLLRDVNDSADCPSDQVNTIRHVASDLLMRLLQTAWSESAFFIDHQVQSRRWQLIAGDITSHSKTATGSVQVLNAWLAVMPDEEAVLVLQEYDLPSLLVSNTIRQFEAIKVEDRSEPELCFDFAVRLEALTHMMACVPQIIEGKLLEDLWTHLYTAHHLPKVVCSQAWKALSSVAHRWSPGSNVVIDAIIHQYLERLSAEDFSLPLLEFLEITVTRELESRRTPATEDDTIFIPGMDRVWRLMLEAPPNTVESNATDFIIKIYLDSDLIRKSSKACVQATHLCLVDRCVRQVISAAANLRSYSNDKTGGENMTIIASQDEIHTEEMRFDRSLLFLRRLLEGMKARPHYSPRPAMVKERMALNFEQRGDPIELNLQIYGSGQLSSDPQMLTTGLDNSGAELWTFFAQLTGFSDFMTINGGRNIPIKDSGSTLKELGLRAGRIILQKSANAEEKTPASGAVRVKSPVDNTVMEHSQELYSLLELEERLASQVYSFLSLFPCRQSILDLVRSRQANADELLPAETPYRLLYCANALRTCLEVESYSQEPDLSFLHYGVSTIIATFPRLERTGCQEQLELHIAQNLLESLTLGLRAKVPQEHSRNYIGDHKVFATNLLRMTLNAQRSGPVHLTPQALVSQPLEVLIEGSLHDERVMAMLEDLEEAATTIKGLILCDSRVEVRKATADVFLSLSGSTGAKLVLKVNDPRAARFRFSEKAVDQVLLRLWPLLKSSLRESTEWPFQCLELFETCASVIRRIGMSFALSDLTTMYQEWSCILIPYQHHERVGLKSEDYVVWGLAKLLQECCRLIKDHGCRPPQNELVDTILTGFLTPGLSASTEHRETPRLPVLSSNTREDLFNLVLMLSSETSEIDSIVTMLDGHIDKDLFFEPHISNERQSLRSEVGYAGMRNLSNTCYLNSLFTQLFMNADLRELILRANVVDPSKQALISELGKVFAYMQSSFEKFVDPSAAVNSIIIPSFGGQEEHIDVAVQMDVDEFYNILFDQIEQQILDPEVRKSFKSIYGGQLVQQVRSKECEHISERFEPFSNIQIEIKGKTGLEDGLRAYVEGEVLQGDNKYSCTSCGRHVDAVKRACLKIVPDHLIFNLKRFDYDIMTGTRCKVNDEFSFPETVDMAPYTVQHLSNPEECIQPDPFELTGVIVHAGTADSGHYYSYVRQRPSMKDKKASWMQFNDVEVTVFDPENMRDACFGGIDTTTTFHWPKIYSAYMLFYQRQSSLQEFGQKYSMKHDLHNPLRLPLEANLELQIRKQNEVFVRSYCTQDPAHARFIRQLLEYVQNAGSKQCSSHHSLEDKIVRVAVEYVQQISSRWKDHPEMDSTFKVLRQMVANCVKCAAAVAEWFSHEPVAIDSLIRSPYVVVRKSFSYLALDSLTKLSAQADEIRERTDSDPTADIYILRYQSILQRLIDTLSGQPSKEALQRHGRAWDQFFEFFTHLLELGLFEAFLILEAGWLEDAYDLVYMHASSSMNKMQRQKWASYLLLREKNRPYHYGGLLNFFSALLERINFKSVSNGPQRSQHSSGLGLTHEEAVKLGVYLPSPKSGKGLEWLKRIVIGHHNPSAASAIIQKLLGDRTNMGLMQQVYSCLDNGLGDTHIRQAVCFVDPVIEFCIHCPSRNLVLSLLKSSCDSVATIGERHGKEHLDLVNGLSRCENTEAPITQAEFEREVLGHTDDWAPVLLVFPDDLHGSVAQETFTLLREILFVPLRAAEKGGAEERFFRRCARRFANGSAKYMKKHYVDAVGKEKLDLAIAQANWWLQTMAFILDSRNEIFDETANARDEEVVSSIRDVVEEVTLLDQTARREAEEEDARALGGLPGIAAEVGSRDGNDSWDGVEGDESGVDLSASEVEFGGGVTSP